MKRRHFFAVLVFVSSLTAAAAEDRFAITVPIALPLAGLADYANAKMATTLVNETRQQTCVEAKQACTKVPEFHGLKIYSRERCVDITPRISCDIEQSARRVGGLSIGGSGDTLTLRQRIDGQATVRGRGEIGSRIRETAQASAWFSVAARPAVGADWRPTLGLNVGIEWIQPPTVRLFNVVDVTFSSRAETSLREAVAAFTRDKLPGELERLRLPQRAAEAWSAMQQPVPIELPGTSSLALVVRPDEAAFSGLAVDATNIRAAVSVGGTALVTDRSPPPVIALPPLGTAPAAATRISVPVDVGFDTLNVVLAAQVPLSLNIKGLTLTLNAARLSPEGGGLRADIDAVVPLLGTTVPLSLTVRGTPVIEGRTLRLVAPRISAGGSTAPASADDPVATALSDALASLGVVDLGPHLDRAGALVAEAMARKLPDGVSLTGSVAISLTDLKFGERLGVVVHGAGDLAVNVDASRFD